MNHSLGLIRMLLYLLRPHARMPAKELSRSEFSKGNMFFGERKDLTIVEALTSSTAVVRVSVCVCVRQFVYADEAIC